MLRINVYRRCRGAAGAIAICICIPAVVLSSTSIAAQPPGNDLPPQRSTTWIPGIDLPWRSHITDELFEQIIAVVEPDDAQRAHLDDQLATHRSRYWTIIEQAREDVQEAFVHLEKVRTEARRWNTERTRLARQGDWAEANRIKHEHPFYGTGIEQFARKDFDRRTGRWAKKLDQLDASWIEGVRTILTDDQLAAFDAVVRDARRKRVMMFGGMEALPYSIVYIPDLLRDIDVSPDEINDREVHQQLLAEYERELDSALTRMLDALLTKWRASGENEYRDEQAFQELYEMEMELGHPPAIDGPTPYEKRFARQRREARIQYERHRQVMIVNRRYAESIATTLIDGAREKFEQAVMRKSLWQLRSREMNAVDTALAEARLRDDLSAGQLDLLAALEAEYRFEARESFHRLCRLTVADYEALRLRESRVIDDATEQRQAEAKQNLEAAWADRRKLEDVYADEIARVLGGN